MSDFAKCLFAGRQQSVLQDEKGKFGGILYEIFADFGRITNTTVEWVPADLFGAHFANSATIASLSQSLSYYAHFVGVKQPDGSYSGDLGRIWNGTLDSTVERILKKDRMMDFRWTFPSIYHAVRYVWFESESL